jgi:hypothetical protein
MTSRYLRPFPASFKGSEVWCCGCKEKLEGFANCRCIGTGCPNCPTHIYPADPPLENGIRIYHVCECNGKCGFKPTSSVVNLDEQK